MDVVVSFNITEGFRGKGYGLPAVILELGKYSAGGVTRTTSICLDAKRSVVERDGEDRACDDGLAKR